MVRPILDRVLLRKLKEKQEGLIEKPDAYTEAVRFEVVEVGDFVILAGQRFPISEFVNIGDVVFLHPYDYEELPLNGEKLYVTRVQNIKVRERRRNAKSRAA